MTAKSIELIKKTEAIFIKWKSIDNAVDMRKNKLTLVQYETIPYIWHDLVQLGVEIGRAHV